MISLNQTIKVTNRLLEAFLCDYLEISRYKAIASDYASIIQEISRFIYELGLYEEYEGQKWVYIILSPSEVTPDNIFTWKEKFPHLSSTSIWERLKTLESSGLIERRKFQKKRFNQKCFYRINELNLINALNEWKKKLSNKVLNYLKITIETVTQWIEKLAKHFGISVFQSNQNLVSGLIQNEDTKSTPTKSTSSPLTPSREKKRKNGKPEKLINETTINPDPNMNQTTFTVKAQVLTDDPFPANVDEKINRNFTKGLEQNQYSNYEEKVKFAQWLRSPENLRRLKNIHNWKDPFRAIDRMVRDVAKGENLTYLEEFRQGLPAGHSFLSEMPWRNQETGEIDHRFLRFYANYNIGNQGQYKILRLKELDHDYQYKNSLLIAYEDFCRNVETTVQSATKAVQLGATPVLPSHLERSSPQAEINRIQTRIQDQTLKLKSVTSHRRCTELVEVLPVSSEKNSSSLPSEISVNPEALRLIASFTGQKLPKVTEPQSEPQSESEYLSKLESDVELIKWFVKLSDGSTEQFAFLPFEDHSLNQEQAEMKAEAIALRKNCEIVELNLVSEKEILPSYFKELPPLPNNESVKSKLPFWMYMLKAQKCLIKGQFINFDELGKQTIIQEIQSLTENFLEVCNYILSLENQWGQWFKTEGLRFVGLQIIDGQIKELDF